MLTHCDCTTAVATITLITISTAPGQQSTGSNTDSRTGAAVVRECLPLCVCLGFSPDQPSLFLSLPSCLLRSNPINFRAAVRCSQHSQCSTASRSWELALRPHLHRKTLVGRLWRGKRWVAGQENSMAGWRSGMVDVFHPCRALDRNCLVRTAGDKTGLNKGIL